MGRPLGCAPPALQRDRTLALPRGEALEWDREYCRALDRNVGPSVEPDVTRERGYQGGGQGVARGLRSQRREAEKWGESNFPHENLKTCTVPLSLDI